MDNMNKYIDRWIGEFGLIDSYDLVDTQQARQIVIQTDRQVDASKAIFEQIRRQIERFKDRSIDG